MKQILTINFIFTIIFNLNSQQYLSTKYEYDLSDRLEVIYQKDSAASAYGIPSFTFQYDGVGNRLYNVNYYFLPVSLLNFTAENLSNNALLTFQTASETNNSGFIIQRSFNAYQFDSIGFVKGNGNSNQLKNYRYLDFQPTQGKSGIVYYRLKQVDYDGKSELSSIKDVVFKFEDLEVLVFPNPTTGILNIQISDSSEYNIEVFNLSGQLILKSQISRNTTLNLNDLPKGVYFLRLYNIKSSIYRKIILN